MEYQYYTTDVFTNQLFNGAHIAVFPQASGLSDNLMQQIANELNLTGTVFIFPEDSNKNKENNSQGFKSEPSRRLRIFNAHEEIDFAAPPIIAAGHILAATGELASNEETHESKLSLQQNIGDIDTYVTHEQDNKSFVQFSLKNITANIDLFAPDTHELADFLGLEDKAINFTHFNPKIVTTEQSYLIIPVRGLDAIQKAAFNYSAWSRSTAPATNARQILLFTNKTFALEGNFHLRLLGPNIGLDEDPPVGSSIPAFTSYLNSFKKVQSGTHTFTVERGSRNTRQSILQIEAKLSKTDLISMRIGGSAVSVSEAKIHIPG